MTLVDLIAALDVRGVRLTARLEVDAPAGVLTPELRAALSAHKPALLARLVGAGVERPTRETGTYTGTIYQDGLGTQGAPCLLRVRRTVTMPACATGGPATIATCILWPDDTRTLATRQADAADPYAIAERLAIQAEGEPT
jgi:hypothetical protein